jgi:hypothetical protein
MESTMLIVFGILGGWLLLSVAVCVLLGSAIRQADVRDAVQVAEAAGVERARRKRPLSAA